MFKPFVGFKHIFGIIYIVDDYREMHVLGRLAARLSGDSFYYKMICQSVFRLGVYCYLISFIHLRAAYFVQD